MTTLATKYRPRTFRDLKGQSEKSLLWNLTKEGATLPPVLLFNGPSGVGKTTAARILAAAVNCDELVTGDPCGTCANCVATFAHNHPSVIETDGSRSGGADNMRDLLNDALVSHGARTTVFIIDEAQGLSAQAWNIMLKVFEEPPPGVLFILTTHAPTKIPPSIRNRALRFDFTHVSPSLIQETLELVIAGEGLTFDAEEISLIVDQCEGSPRAAIMLLEQMSHSSGETRAILGGRNVAFEVLHAAVRNDRIEGLRLLSEAFHKTGDARGIVEQLGSAMEKVLMAKYEIPTYLSPSKAVYLRELASALDDSRWASGMEVLADWVLNVKSGSHLIFVFTSFLKALHGPVKVSVAQDSGRADRKLLSDEDALTLLQGIEL